MNDEVERVLQTTADRDRQRRTPLIWNKVLNTAVLNTKRKCRYSLQINLSLSVCIFVCSRNERRCLGITEVSFIANVVGWVEQVWRSRQGVQVSHLELVRPSFAAKDKNKLGTLAEK